MYFLNQNNIEDIIEDKEWHGVDERPYKHVLALLECCIDGGHMYEICRYSQNANAWEICYANNPIGCLYTNVKVLKWTVITRKEAAKIWDTFPCQMHLYEKCDIYDGYRKYLSDFLEQNASCSPEDNIYPTPLSFIKWMKVKEIDIEAIYGDE